MEKNNQQTVQQSEQQPIKQSVQQSINERLNIADQFLGFDRYTDKTLVEWFEPLVSSISENGAVPYLLDVNDRFRASPLASTIIWMDKASLLPESAVELMQSRLLYLRDNNEPGDRRPGKEKKLNGDEEGWSLAEGVSVWSTSMAIIAMIDRNFVGLKKAMEYKASVLWLARQKRTGENGWGYQCYKNCDQSIIMTSLAVRAIAIALKHSDAFGFTDNEVSSLKQVVHSGFIFIKSSMNKNTNEVYWCFGDKKSCVATTWALLALKELQDLSLNSEINGFYLSVIKNGRNSIINSIPKNSVRWGDESLVDEAGAKYGAMKNYYSFSPTLIMDILDLDVSPYNIRIIKQIRWLLNNSSEWKIKKYDTESICTFTYAMVLSTIAKWVSLVGKENAERLVCAQDHKTNQIFEFFIGYPRLGNSSMQVIDKARVMYVLVILLLALLIFLNRAIIIGFILKIIFQYIVKEPTTVNTVIINIVSNAIFLLITTILATIGGRISKIITRRFME